MSEPAMPPYRSSRRRWRLGVAAVSALGAVTIVGVTLLGPPGRGPARATAAAPSPSGQASARAVSAAAISYPVHGIDVSKNQNTSTASINWATVVRGEQFAMIKATRGKDFTSPYFRTGWAAMTRSGIARAPYHYLMPRDQGTVSAQIAYFVRTVRAAGYTGRARGELPPVLDVEWDYRDGSCLTGVSAADVKAAVDQLVRAFGRRPIIYTNAAFLSGCGLDSRVFAPGTLLWIARYSTSRYPTVPPGWSTWTFWQYTDKGQVAGVPRPVDRDWYHGDLASLRKLARLR